MDQITLCGVRIHDLTREQALAEALRERPAPCVVVTPNALMLERCRRTPHYAALLNRATLSLPDGSGVLRAARRCGTPLRERIPGIEFGEALLQAAAERGERVFLLGGAPGVATRAAQQLIQRYPGLAICGTHHGYFAKEGKENRRVIEVVQRAAPEILFVCFGFPLQEEWMEQNLEQLPSLRLAAGLGGSLDVWAGDLRRAPSFLGNLGLEWAWRMLWEPKRWKQFPLLLRFALHSGKVLQDEPQR